MVLRAAPPANEHESGNDDAMADVSPVAVDAVKFPGLSGPVPVAFEGKQQAQRTALVTDESGLTKRGRAARERQRRALAAIGTARTAESAPLLPAKNRRISDGAFDADSVLVERDELFL